MAGQSDNARFVITGEFNSANVLNQIEAMFSQMGKKFDKHLGQFQKNINDSVGGAGAATGAKSVERAMGGVAAGAEKTKKSVFDMEKTFGRVNADLWVAARRVVLWGAASRVVFGITQKIAESITDVVELNRILVNIAKIRPVGLPTSLIGENIIDAAKRYGVAFQEIGETQRTFYQAGFDIAEVNKLVEAQLLGVTAANLSAQESIELLIGAMSVFKISAENSISLIDKLQQVQANFAVSTQDLATALRRVGPVIEQLGGNINHVIGVITALKEATRKSGEFIGTALSTIFSRIVTPVGANALRGVGISINKTAVELRDLENILDDVGRQWENFSDQQKFSIAFALGARRRYAQVVALFDNYATALDTAGVAQTAFGAALRAQQVEVTSVSRQFQIVRENIKEIGIAFLNAFAQTEGGAAKGLVSLAKSLQNVLDNVRRFIPKAAEVARGLSKWVIFGTIGSLVFTLSNHFVRLTIQTGAFALQAAGLIPIVGGVGIAITGLTTAMVALNAALGIVAAIGAYVAMKKLSQVMTKQKEDVPELADAYERYAIFTEKQQKTLKEYYRVAQQFKNVKGPEALRDFLGTDLQKGTDTIIGKLIEMKGAAEDLNNISLSDFERAVISVRGPNASVDQAREDLNNIIGLYRAAEGGLRNSREAITQDWETTRALLISLFSEVDKIKPGQTNYDVNDVFELLMGTSPEDFAKKARQIVPLLSKDTYTNEEAANVMAEGEKNVRDAIRNQLVNGNSEYNKMFSEIADTRGDILDKFEDLIFNRFFIDTFGKTTAKKEDTPNLVDYYTGALDQFPDTIVKGLLLKVNPKFDKEAFIKDLEKASAFLLSEDFLSAELGKMERESGAVNIPLALSATDPTRAEQNITKLAAATELANKASSEFTKRLTEEARVLEMVSKAIEEQDQSILYFAKKIAKAHIDILSFNNDIVSLSSGFNQAALESKVFGTQIGNLQKTLLKGRIKEGLEKLVAVRELKNSIQQLQSINKELEILNKRGEADPNLALRADDLRKKLLRSNDSIKNLEASLADANAEISDTESILNTLIDALNSLTTNTLKGEVSMKVASKAASEYKKSIENSLKTLDSFYEKQQKIITQFANLGLDGNFAAQLGNALDGIDEKYERLASKIQLQVAAEKDALSIGRQRITVAAEEFRTKTQLSDSILKTLDKELEVQESLDTLHAGIGDKVKDTSIKLETQYQTRLNILEANYALLDSQKANEQKLAAMNSLLESAKKEQANINSLASDYASSIGDLVTDLQSLIGERGFARQVLEPFADAYVESVSDRLSQSLELLFQSAASKTIGSQISVLKEELDAYQKQSSYNEAANIMYMKITEAALQGGELMGLSFLRSVSSYDTEGNQVSTSVSDQYQQVISKRIAQIQAGVAGLVATSNAELAEQITSTKQALAQTQKTQAVVSAVQSLGLVLGNLVAGGTAEGALGAGIGGNFGMLLASAKGFNPIASAVSAVAGSVVGGLVGRLFGGKEEEEVQEVELKDPSITAANTEALRQNTEALVQASQDFSFMSKLVNAPSNFSLPAQAILGGGMPVNVEVTINASDNVYDVVSKAYVGDSRRIGRRG